MLKEDGILEQVEARAWKRALALQLRRLLVQRELSKSEMAARMKTSSAAVDRLLDESNPSVTMVTLEKAASALGAIAVFDHRDAMDAETCFLQFFSASFAPRRFLLMRLAAL